MIPIAELVSVEALRRYDDTGEPAYTCFERVLITLRWFDWATCGTIIDALGVDVDDRLERQRYESALRYWFRHGRIARRPRLNDWPAVFEYRLLAPSEWTDVESCRRCSRPRAIGSVLCDVHKAWQRENKRARRAA